MNNKKIEALILGNLLASTKKGKSARDMHNINVRVSLPGPYFEIWQGIKAMHGLDEEFLNFMASQMIKNSLLTFMEMSDFAE